jgi:HEAT repeat protein
MATLLSALTQPNTEAIRSAEAELKPILKDPRSVPALMEILSATGDAQNESIRLTAAVLLRKRLATHYAGFDAETKSSFQGKVLSILGLETSRSVRHGMASVAAIVAKIEAARWPELFQFINQASQDPNPDARELAFFLLSEMTETVGEHLKEEFPQMSGMFDKGLIDAENKVQIAAVKALGQLLSYLADEPYVDHFAVLLPKIMEVSNKCLQRNDEETVSVTLDVLYDLAYSPSASVTAHLKTTIQFCMTVLVNPVVEMSVRDSAALVVATLAECKPKKFGKEEALLNSVIESLFVLIENCKESAAGALFESNPAWKEDVTTDADGDSADDEDIDSPTETSMAQGTLDMLACELPKKYIFQPVITRCVSRLSSQQPGQRKAGIACLGVMAEGCSEPIRQHLAEIIPHVLGAAGDGDAQVRECACFALGQLSEHCQPEILAYSTQVLPTVFSLLDDATVSVQATSCYVLEMFCERLEPDGVRPLLDSLVRKLASMLETTDKRSVQEMAVAALAATAVAAEEEFAPYIAGVATLMQKLLQLKDETMFSLRGRALECMGHMAIAVGKDHFRPYFSSTMMCACEGLTLDSVDLHEFAYAVFANLSKVMGEEFSSVLAELVPHLTAAISQDEGQVEAAGEEAKFSGLDDSDDEDEQNNYVLHVRTALLEAKKGAITALGEMAAHTGAAFVPFLETSMETLSKAAENWHPLIKSECAEALPSMVIPTVAAHHSGEIPWTKGDVSSPNPMSLHTSAVVAAVMNQLLLLMKDEDPDTAGKACEGVQSVMELCGPHALIPVAEPILATTHDLISRKAPCQIMHDEDEGPDEFDDDHAPYMTSVCDLIGSITRVMGSQFTSQLGTFLPPVCLFAKSSRPASDRAMAIGCLGEIAQEMEGAIAEFWPTIFLPLYLRVLRTLMKTSDAMQRFVRVCVPKVFGKMRPKIILN